MNWFEKLTICADTFYHATDISAAILSPEGAQLDFSGTEYSYCKLFQEASGNYCPCGTSHVHACQEAGKLHDGYIFACPAGYVHFAVPVYHKQNLVAYLLAGPISLEYPDLDQIDLVMQKYDLSLEYRSKLYGAYSSAPLVEPHRARYYCKLLTLLIMNLSSEEDNQFINRYINQTIQQAKIGEYIHLIKDSGISTGQYQQEQEFLADVIAGNVTHAKSVLNEMLGNIYFASGNNFEIIRTRSIELIAVMSRAIVENGGNHSDVYHMTDSAMRSINKSNNLTDLSYTLLEILDSFMSSAFDQYPQQDSPYISSALAYISENFFRPLTLSEVARQVGMNPSYLSKLFKQKLGVSFTAYLTDRRITQAKRLLRKSNLSLVDISIAVGYENQSYFSKVFKDVVGMTPKQYRRSVD